MITRMILSRIFTTVDQLSFTAVAQGVFIYRVPNSGVKDEADRRDKSSRDLWAKSSLIKN